MNTDVSIRNTFYGDTMDRKPKFFIIMLILSIFFTIVGVSEPRAENMRGTVVKIPVTSEMDVKEITNQVLDLLVVEDDYVVARITRKQKENILRAGFKVLKLRDKDLVKRLVKIKFKDKAELSQITEIGVDVWEIESDHVVAQATDKHIRKLEKIGVDMELLHRNSRDAAKTQGRN